MSHLRDAIAALVDGELDGRERDRALTHLASCPRCRAEVAAHRALKERMAGLAAPAVPARLSAGLAQMAPPAAAPAPIAPAALAPGRHRRRARAVLTGGSIAVAATFVAAFVVGGEPGETTPVVPDFDTFLVEHVRSSRELPLTDLPAIPADVVPAILHRSGR